MRYHARITQVLLLLIFGQKTFAQAFVGIPKKIEKIVKSGKIYRNAKVTSKADNQTLDYQIYGLHPDKCSYALKKLSRYERFHEHMDLIKLSGYDEKKQLIYLYLDSKLMPFPMVLNFKIERITKPGHYKFSFDKGFLKGLKGNIHVKEYGQRCFFHADSYWSGKKSSIPDTVFEIFSETLGELAMTKLFRVSKQL